LAATIRAEKAPCEHTLQLVEERCIDALVQHRRAHVTGCRGIELNHLQQRSGVVVPHCVAGNALKIAALAGKSAQMMTLQQARVPRGVKTMSWLV